MVMKDYRCRECGFEVEYLSRPGRPDPRLEACTKCQAVKPFEEIVKHVHHVKPDDVPGGFWIENLDAVPRWFPSHSAFHQELSARGLTTEQGNQWRGDPGNGSDKPRNGLSRWVAPPTISEPDRIKAWYEHELAEFGHGYMENTSGQDH